MMIDHLQPVFYTLPGILQFQMGTKIIHLKLHETTRFDGENWCLDIVVTIHHLLVYEFKLINPKPVIVHKYHKPMCIYIQYIYPKNLQFFTKRNAINRCSPCYTLKTQEVSSSTLHIHRSVESFEQPQLSKNRRRPKGWSCWRAS